jgi:hypothetical protein
MLKLELANGLWIGITPKILPKLMMVEETLIARYCCYTILVKLRYINKGNTIGQHAFKGNVVSFAQDPKSAVKLLDTLPLSLEYYLILLHYILLEVHTHL